MGAPTVAARARPARALRSDGGPTLGPRVRGYFTPLRLADALFAACCSVADHKLTAYSATCEQWALLDLKR